MAWRGLWRLVLVLVAAHALMNPLVLPRVPNRALQDVALRAESGWKSDEERLRERLLSLQPPGGLLSVEFDAVEDAMELEDPPGEKPRRRRSLLSRKLGRVLNRCQRWLLLRWRYWRIRWHGFVVRRLQPTVGKRMQRALRTQVLPRLNRNQILGLITLFSGELVTREVDQQLNQLPLAAQTPSKILVNQTAQNLLDKVSVLASNRFDLLALANNEVQTLVNKGIQVDNTTEAAVRELVRVQLDMALSTLAENAELQVAQQVNETLLSITEMATQVVDTYNENVEGVFRNIDRDQDGQISAQELYTYLTGQPWVDIDEFLVGLEAQLLESQPPELTELRLLFDSTAGTEGGLQDVALGAVEDLVNATVVQFAEEFSRNIEVSKRELEANIELSKRELEAIPKNITFGIFTELDGWWKELKIPLPWTKEANDTGDAAGEIAGKLLS